MTNEQAKAIIRKEYLCVDRDCDIERNCGKCDLMMPSKEPILEALKMAIKALEQMPVTTTAGEGGVIYYPQVEGVTPTVVDAGKQELCDVFDEYGNYKYPSDVELTEPNTATSMPCEDAISRQAVEDKLLKLCNELEGIFADIRMKEVDDCVCGLCEYDCDHGIDGSAFECPGFEKDECFKLADEIRHEWQSTKDLPPVNPTKTGHWITTSEYYTGAYGNIDYVECSCCHEYSLEDGNFCPNCGAKMFEPQERSDKE